MRVNRFLLLVLLILSSIIFLSAIFGQGKKDAQPILVADLARERAQQVIAVSKKVMFAKSDLSQFKNLSLTFEGTVNYYREEKERQDFSISLPDKIYHNLSSETNSSNWTRITTLNGNFITVRDDSTWQFGAQSSSDFKKSNKPDDDFFKAFSLESSEMLLPYFMEFRFVKSDEIKHIGVADVDSGKADVIEVKVEDRTYLLIFDQKSHHLVMMVKKFLDNGKLYERNYYFTEYKLSQNLMIPHKIVMTGTTSRGTNIYVERNLKKLVLNESFDPKLFEIKDK